ncbi:hypothetical protein D7X33_10540 [Butyricicoccus sp. 1XD8-22]|nr:hypothetical protein D7X33_10540 [Butyricicoccus sp. 1XD8-22]
MVKDKGRSCVNSFVPPAGDGRDSKGTNRRHQMRPSGRAAVSLSGGARFSSAPQTTCQWHVV